MSDSTSVVIALGEDRDGRLGYQPDALLVIFDEGIARSFRIPAGSGSAWGQPLHFERS